LMAIDPSPADVSRDHFSTLVKDWSTVGQPLRPAPEDTAVVQRVVNGLGAAPRVVILGLTPETLGCSWPAATGLTAVDHSPAMIRALWDPGRAPAGALAIPADWRTMPFSTETVDLVAGDGCHIVFSHPERAGELTQEVCRILRPGARYVMRAFLKPERAETIAEIAAAVADGRVASVHALKLRLLAAMQVSSRSGTRLGDVWHIWKTLPAPPAALLGRRGWTPAEIGAIEAYHDLDGHFYLPALVELRAIFQPGFEELEYITPSYELGDRCPTFVLKRR
jgi:SAM-dependent methyltransferase